MSFLYWLKHNATPEETDAWSTQGFKPAQKRNQLRLWLAYRARGHSVDVETVTETKIGTRDTDAELEGWYTIEQMDLTFGPKTAKRWRDSNLLETQACRVTGSKEADCLEYFCKDLTQAKKRESFEDNNFALRAVQADADLDEATRNLEEVRSAMRDDGPVLARSKWKNLRRIGKRKNRKRIAT